MPRRTVVPNLGPTELAFALTGATYDDATNEPTLIAVRSSTQPHPVDADKVVIYTAARQIDGQGRDVRTADRKAVTIPEAVAEAAKTGDVSLYQAMQDEMTAQATRFESAGVAIVTPKAAPPAPAPVAP